MDGILGSTLSRRGVLRGTAATGAAALLGGIGQASAIAAGGRLRVLTGAALQEGGQGTLIMSVPTAPDIFDPHATGGWDTYKHTLQMFEGLSARISPTRTVHSPSSSHALPKVGTFPRTVRHTRFTSAKA